MTSKKPGNDILLDLSEKKCRLVSGSDNEIVSGVRGFLQRHGIEIKWHNGWSHIDHDLSKEFNGATFSIRKAKDGYEFSLGRKWEMRNGETCRDLYSNARSNFIHKMSNCMAVVKKAK